METRAGTAMGRSRAPPLPTSSPNAHGTRAGRATPSHLADMDSTRIARPDGAPGLGASHAGTTRGAARRCRALVLVQEGAAPFIPPLQGSFPIFWRCHLSLSTFPRCGQAIAVIDDALFVHGGNTGAFNSYGYDPAPWTNDPLPLSLSTPFDPSAHPRQYASGFQSVSAPQGAAFA